MSVASKEPKIRLRFRRGAEPLRTDGSTRFDELRPARVVAGGAKEQARLSPLVLKRKKLKRDRHARTRIAVFRFSYYDIAFKFFAEHVLDADFVALPKASKRSLELGSRYSSDTVCAPFKHILGDYIEALERGADVLVQVTGPCRLGYYGELQESILRDLGYEFEMLNFATVAGKPATDYIALCKKKVNPKLSVPKGVRNMLAFMKMIEFLDEANDFYLANAAFEVEAGAFERTRKAYFDVMRSATCEKDIVAAQHAGMDAFKAIRLDKPADPLRVGIVGEYFTAPDPTGNLGLERKLLDLGVEVHRAINITNRNLRYHEKNLRASASDYIRYNMGPTSTLTIATALSYAQQGFDGIIHAKSSGCTPEIDCIPILQRISCDTGVPILYLSYDSQTSDTGLNTRLEAFYDMIAMGKGALR